MWYYFRYNYSDYYSKQRQLAMSDKTKTFPGLSFSWKRALGISQARQKFARSTGIPTSKAGAERKIGSIILKTLFGKK